MKPIVLIDVDGPLNPYATLYPQGPDGYVSHRMKPKGFEYGKGLKVLLNPLHGPLFLSLEAELVWATMWEDDANKWISPHIGLPELDFIPWTDYYHEYSSNLYFKTRRIAEWMNANRPGQPFIWIDDECKQDDLDYLRENCTGFADVMIISPRIGLIERDFDSLKVRIAEMREMG